RANHTHLNKQCYYWLFLVEGTVYCPAFKSPHPKAGSTHSLLGGLGCFRSFVSGTSGAADVMFGVLGSLYGCLHHCDGGCVYVCFVEFCGLAHCFEGVVG